MTIHDLCRERLARQHLLQPAEPLTIAGDLCGIQAQFLSYAMHALRIRTTQPSVDGLVKSWTLRGTMHLFPESDLPLYFRRHGQPEDVTDTDWYRWSQTHGGVNPPERERYFARLITDAIAGGMDTREALRTLCREQCMTDAEEARLFHSWGGIIAELAQAGVLCFKVQEEKAYRPCPAFTPMDAHAAELELARRYFTHYGPATLRDAAYFFHATQAQVKHWLKELPVASFTLEGREYFHIPTAAAQLDTPPCLLLAGFDPLLLGYRKEDNPFLPPEHLRKVFSLSGIVHPTILLNGRIVGRWKQKDGRLTLCLFEAISERDKRHVLDRAGQLWQLRHVDFTPADRSPGSPRPE